MNASGKVKRNTLFFNHIRTIAIVLLFIVGLVPFFHLATPAYAAPSLVITGTSSATTVDSGVEFAIKFQYRCASTTEHCYGVQIKTDLPADISYISMEGNNHIDSMTYTAPTATWTFKSPLSAGSTGEVTIKLMFKNDGTCAPGTPATFKGTMSATNVPVSVESDGVTVTSSSSNLGYQAIKSVSGGSFLFADASGTEIGSTVTYDVKACQPVNSNQGGINLTNVAMTDTLPPGAIFQSVTSEAGETVKCDGGVCAAGNSYTTITWTGMPDLNVGSGQVCHTRNVTLNFPGDTPGVGFDTGNTITNQLSFTGTKVTGGGVSANTSHIGTLQGPTYGGSGIVKSANVPYMNPGGKVTYSIAASNSSPASNSPLENTVITDVVPAEVTVDTINTRVNNSQTITVSYSTDASAPYSWTQLAIHSTDGDHADVAPPGVTALKWEYGPFPLDQTTTGGEGTGFVATVKPATPIGTAIKNTAVMTSPSLSAVKTTNEVVVNVYNEMPRPSISKDVLAGASAKGGDIVKYKVTLTNDSHTGTALEKPVLVDWLNPNLQFVAGSVVYGGTGGAPDPIFIPTDNYSGTGKTRLLWSWPAFDLPTGKTIEIEYQVKVKDNAPAGTISNEAALSGWANANGIDLDKDTKCHHKEPDTYDLDGDGNTIELMCVSNGSNVDILTIVQLESILEVKGQLDNDWHRFPSYGRTVHGGMIEYRLFIENVGNTAVKNLSLVDILPYVGDTGVIDTVPRGSEWQPQFTELLVVPSGVTAYYSIEENPLRPDLLPSGPPDGSPPNWSTIAPADPTDVHSFKIDFGNRILQPKDKVEVRWSMHAPLGVPDELIAWNSFGYVGVRVDTGTALLPSEPIKVGIVVEEPTGPTYGNYVWLEDEATKNGIQNVGESGVNLVRVDLYNAGPDGAHDGGDDTFVKSTYTTNDHSGNKGYYLFSDLEPGSYYAVFHLPVGYGFSPADQGGNDAIDSDADASTGRTAVTTLDPSEHDLSWDAAIYKKTTAVVGNYVWFDRNNDGVQNESPSDGLNGVTVQLYDSSNVLKGTTTTTFDAYGNPGSYYFDNLTPGDYYIKVALPTGAIGFTSQNIGNDAADSDVNASGQTATFTLSAGEIDLTWDAGIKMPTQTLKLGNLVWKDNNNNGTVDSGEQGIDGVKMNLYRDNGSTAGEIDATDQFVGTTTTFSKGGIPGYYEFDQLIAGDYIVTVDASNFSDAGALDGLGSSTATIANPNATPSPDNQDHGEPKSGYGVVSKAVTLTVNGEPIDDGDIDTNTNMSMDFGFYELAALGDYVWLDSTTAGTQGQQDAAESGINGVTVKLYDVGPDGNVGTADDILLKVTTTANDTNGNPGYYVFEDLEADDYYVEFIIPSNLISAGATFTTKDSGADASDSDADTTTGKTGKITLASGEKNLTIDAGIKVNGTAKLGNLVWYDLNNDGNVDGGENGIFNVRVNLYQDVNSNGAYDSGDTFFASTTTDSSGNYLFENLPAGNYLVQIDPSNHTSSKPLDGYANSTITGNDPDTDTDDNDDNGNPLNGMGVWSPAVTLSAGEMNLTVDFGFYKLAKLGDYVWIDSDDDGQQDALEIGLSSVTVRLYKDTNGTVGDGNGITDDIVIDTTVTDANGKYLFPDLAPGNYYVQFFVPPGYKLTQENRGGDTTDSDADFDKLHATTYTKTGIYTLNVGDSNLTVDAGMIPIVSVGNRVWRDDDNDGILDTGEVGIAGVKVNLYKDTNSNNVYDDGTDTLVDTTTTNVNGYYAFNELSEGRYIVVVDKSNFATATDPLYRFASSTGNDPAPDPDNDVDNDDNGYTGPTGHVISKAVQLIAGLEPITDQDGSTGNTTVDFGFYPYVSLGNRVWKDLNNDGIYEPGSHDGANPGINGVKLWLYRDANNDGQYQESERVKDAAGNDLEQTTRDEAGEPGYYFFDELQPGKYIVRIPDTENFAAGKPLNGMVSSTHQGNTPTTWAGSGFTDLSGTPEGDKDSDDNGKLHATPANGVVSMPIELTFGGEPTADVRGNKTINNTVDFGFFPTLTLGNLVWLDKNNDGDVDGGESGINGVTLRLYWDKNGNGAWDAGDQSIGTTDTAGGGLYTFTGLHPAPYIVRVENGEFGSGQQLYRKWPSTGQGITNASGPDLSPNPNTDQDDNDDNGGTYIPGQGVYVTHAVVLTIEGEPDTAVDGDGTSSNKTIDFGFFDLLSLGDVVWYDYDNNGVQDGGEPGIQGVTLELYHDTNGNGTYDAGVDVAAINPVATTDASGKYLFTDLLPGDYIVMVQDTNFTGAGKLVGYYNSQGDTIFDDPDDDDNTDDNGGARTVGDGVVSKAVTLHLDSEPITDGDASTSSNLSVDFGFYQKLSLGNVVWHDQNNDGDKDAGEPTFDGVKVNLYLDSNDDGTPDTAWGSPFKTTTTAGGGLYAFTDLDPGTYIVQIDNDNFDVSGDVLYEYLSSTGNGVSAPDPDTNTNNDDNGDLHATPTNGVVSKPITLKNEDEPDTAADGDGKNGNTTVDFGFYHKVRLGNRVWHDADGDGTYDVGETPIGGVTVNLYLDSNNDGTPDGGWASAPLATTTTAAGTGLYLFDNLDPNHYIVQIADSNFTAAGVLKGYSSTRGNDVMHGVAPDPDTNTDEDDSGNDYVSGQGVFSKPVTVYSGDEPDTAADTDDKNGNMTVDFGFYTFSLGNRVWYDTNNNGLMDDGASSGIAGVKVNLYFDANNDGDILDAGEGTAIATMNTDADGYYLFDKLIPGNYLVELDASNFTGVLKDYTSSTGTNGSASGTYETAPTVESNATDTDDNGSIAGTLGSGGTIRSSLVTLSFAANEPTASDTETGPAPATNKHGLAPDERSNLTVDFGVYKPVTLGNRVWDDVNNNGVMDAGETGIADVKVNLYYDADKNGSLDGAETTTIVATDTTDANGYYLFDYLLPGTYRVTLDTSNFEAGGTLRDYTSSSGTNASPGGPYEPAPDANIDSPAVDKDDNGSVIGTLGNGSGGDIQSSLVVLTLDGEPINDNDLGTEQHGHTDDDSSNLSVDFGVYKPVTLGNRVWNDKNNNGLMDAGEVGINGVLVNLYFDANGDGDLNDGTENTVAISQTTTVNGGYYLFDHLEAGTYIVELAESNFTGVGVLKGYSGSTGTIGSPTGAYEAGKDVDSVPDDEDDNGTINGTLGSAGGVIRSSIVTLSVDGEPAGEDENTALTYPHGHAADTSSNLTVDFGVYKLVTLGNRVWIDNNNDGLINDGANPGKDGVTVNLYRDTDGNGTLDAGAEDTTIVASTTTANGGYYLFDYLVEGNYVVEIAASNFASGSLLEGYTSSTGKNGAASDAYEPGHNAETDTDDTDDNGTIAKGTLGSGGVVRSHLVTLALTTEPTNDDDLNTAVTPFEHGHATDDSSNLTVDFGLFRPLSLGNFVWYDIDNSGDYNSGTESGVDGVVVNLYDSTGTTLISTTTTAGGGFYRFDYLTESDYIVEIAAENFDSGKVLHTYHSSSGNDVGGSTPDPDNDTNSDDNGNAYVPGVGVRSKVVSLRNNDEPDSDGDLDKWTNLSVDFGFHRLLSLGNLVWWDIDNDGYYEPLDFETGVDALAMELYRDNGDGVYSLGDVLSGTTTTDANGHYIFSNLLPGNYIVVITQTNFVSGAKLYEHISSTGPGDQVNPNTDIDNDDNGTLTSEHGIVSRAVILIDGKEPPSGGGNDGDSDVNTNYSVDFGIHHRLLSLGNLVWWDINNDGNYDEANEKGIANVDLALYWDTDNNGMWTPGTDSISGTTKTDGTGHYTFTKLLPGYYVVVISDTNFVGSGALVGYLNSNGNGDIAPDPDNDPANDDDDINNDDNGDLFNDKWVVSKAVTLIDGHEPDNDGDNDNRSNLTVDFGFHRLMSLGNVVWWDADNDGYWQNHEKPFDGVTIQLYRDSDKSGNFTPGTDIFSGTTTTDASGHYLFSDLLPGDYIVVITETNFIGSGKLVDYISSTGPHSKTDANTDINHDDNGEPMSGHGVVSRMVRLTDGKEPTNDEDATAATDRSNLTIDFGFHRLLSLGNLVWWDVDNNGKWDSNEKGIENVAVSLYKDSDNDGVPDSAIAVDTTTTDSTGHYTFTNLLPYTYVVVIGNTNFASGNALHTYVSSNGNDDTNGNAPDPDDDANHDDNGNAYITGKGVRSGSVVLVDATEPMNDEDTSSKTDRTNYTVDFGFHRLLTIGNVVWWDGDNSGTWDDTTEKGIGGVTVNLYRDANNDNRADSTTPLKTMQTDTTGHYIFTDLVPGHYVVEIASDNFAEDKVLYGFISTMGTNGTDGSAPDPDDDINNDDNGNPLDASGNLVDSYNPFVKVTSKSITLIDDTEPTNDGDSSTLTNLTVDFGFLRLLTLGNLVWYDNDNNGTVDSDKGETGIAGVTVNLYWDKNDDGIAETGTISKTTTTDASGYYTFTDLLPGNYFVEIAESNFTSGGKLVDHFSSSGNDVNGKAPDPDNNENNDDNGNARIIGSGQGVRSGTITLQDYYEPTDDGDTLTSSNLSLDFGFYRLVNLGNQIWLDQDNNGMRDTGEPGLGSVVVELYRDSDSNGSYTHGTDVFSGTTTTDANGHYAFTHLLPGTYIVVITQTNFVDGGTLVKHYSSTGNGDGVDPDNNIDNDDNGDPQPGYGMISKAVTLWAGNEPENDKDGDGYDGNLTVDFGFYRLVNLGDLVWWDKDNNGLRDDGETGIGSVTLELYRDTGDGKYTRGTDIFSGTTTTDASGHYTFTNLMPGNYIVVIASDNFDSGKSLFGFVNSDGTNGGNEETDANSDINNDDNGESVYGERERVVSRIITLTTQGEPDSARDGDDDDGNMTLDFGFHQLVSLGNLVWYDVNNNGRWDSSEKGVRSVQVNLYQDSDQDNTPDTDMPLKTMLTDDTGHYTFTNLQAGWYLVTVDAANFTTGRALDGYASSTGDGTTDAYPDPAATEHAADTNASTNHDDDGVTSKQNGTQMVISRAIQVTPGDEPDSDEDLDTNSNLTVDFGFYKLATIGNRVWQDDERNGLQDSNEVGVENVRITLYRKDGTKVAETRTASGGSYQFTHLIPGDYYLIVEKPDDFMFTLNDAGNDDTLDNDADPTTGQTIVTTLDLGEDDTSWDIGLYSTTASLGNKVWHDLNHNGMQDSNEPGVANVRVKLLTSDGKVLTETLTSDSGMYIFRYLDKGDYYIEVDLPKGYAFTRQDAGTTDGDDANDSDVDRKTGRTAKITLREAESQLIWDIGLELTSIGNRVWLDKNRDGIQDSDEPGMANITVELYRGTEKLSQTVTSNTGLYIFDNLWPGDYSLKFITPDGHVFTTRDAGSDDSADSDADTSTGFTVQTTLEAGEQDMSWDVGMYNTRTAIGNRVWLDVNENGIQDDGEPGIPDVEVTLVSRSGTKIATVRTDKDGTYLFTNVKVGDYRITVTVPRDYQVTTKDVGSNDEHDSDADTNGSTDITTLESGEIDLSWDVGLTYVELRIGDRVWLDTNRDGMQDKDEPGLADMTITLYDSNDREIGTTTTDKDGYYSFTLKKPGHYYLVFKQPKGYIITRQNVGDDRSRDSDADSESGKTTIFTLKDGESDLTWDAGLYSEVTILALKRDTLAHDSDGNGVPSAGDTLRYEIAITNTSAFETSDVVFSDEPDSNTVLVDGSVLSSQGSVVQGNNDGDTTVRVKVGDLDAGAGMTITFEVAINAPLSQDITELRNQGTVTGKDNTTEVSVLTDDPDTEEALDVTVTVLNTPQVSIKVKKMVNLARIAPRQVLTYTIDITNTSKFTKLAPVVVTDIMDEGLKYVDGSTNVMEPRVKGQQLLWADITQGAGLAPGEHIRITYRAIVSKQIGTYFNRVYVEGFHRDGSVKDDDKVPFTVEDPVVEVHKGVAAPGVLNGVITFTINITNAGPSALDQVPLVDHFFGPIAYIGGYPQADMIDNKGQVIGWSDLTEQLGDMQPGHVYVVTTVFQLLVPASSDVEINNTATVNNAQDVYENNVSDQSSTVVTRLRDPETPSAIELLSFKARHTGDAVEVEWVTGAEIDTWGFHLLRSSDGSRASAVRVTPEMILAQGTATSGASYRWVDTQVEEGVTYTYWIEETETTGKVNEYGPSRFVSLQTMTTVMLPFVAR